MLYLINNWNPKQQTITKAWPKRRPAASWLYDSYEGMRTSVFCSRCMCECRVTIGLFSQLVPQRTAATYVQSLLNQNPVINVGTWTSQLQEEKGSTDYHHHPLVSSSVSPVANSQGDGVLHMEELQRRARVWVIVGETHECEVPERVSFLLYEHNDGYDDDDDDDAGSDGDDYRQLGGMKRSNPEQTYTSPVLVTPSLFTPWHTYSTHNITAHHYKRWGGHAPPAPGIMARTCLPCHLCLLIVSLSYRERNWRHCGFLTAQFLRVRVCVRAKTLQTSR